MINEYFDNGWTDETTGQVPVGWAVNYLTGDCDWNHNGWMPPETRLLTTTSLPPDEHDKYLNERDWSLKLFASHKSYDVTFTYNRVLPQGKYKIELEYWDDCYHECFKCAPVDPLSYEFQVGLTDTNSGWQTSNFQQNNIHEFEFEGSGYPYMRFRSRWGILHAGIFIKRFILSEVETTEPPLNYKAIPILLPQDSTLDEVLSVRRAEYENRRTITQSHDEVIRLVNLGKDGSYAIIYALERWPEENQQQLLAIPHELRNFDTEFRFTHWPTPHKVVTQKFGVNRDIYDDYLCNGQPLLGHDGTDVRAFHRDPVYVVADGVVSDIHTSPNGHNYGIFVRVDHADNYQTTYAHLDEINVSLGQYVSGGDLIGLADNTGNSRGSHLHLTLKRIGYTYVNENGESWPCYIHDSDTYMSQFSGVTWPDEPTQPTIDLLPYLKGNGVLYEVRNTNGGQERFQTQEKSSSEFWQTKNSLAEQLFVDSNYIYRGWDTSPGNNRFYQQQEPKGATRARWLPRNMAIGESFSVSLWVQFYNWDCSESQANSGQVTDTRKLLAKFDTWTSPYGITLNDVVCIEWINGGELYWYAKDYGLVGWARGHTDPNTPASSAISEIHDQGQRPDNVVDLPPCL